jgi:hypothetical protein
MYTAPVKKIAANPMRARSCTQISVYPPPPDQDRFEHNIEQVTINIIITIKSIMAMTTISLQRHTKERLDDYKMGNMTYDELLNIFMEKVTIEDISDEHIKEHYKRLNTFSGVTKEEFIKRIRT